MTLRESVTLADTVPVALRLALMVPLAVTLLESLGVRVTEGLWETLPVKVLLWLLLCVTLGDSVVLGVSVLLTLGVPLILALGLRVRLALGLPLRVALTLVLEDDETLLLGLPVRDTDCDMLMVSLVLPVDESLRDTVFV